MGYLLLTVDLLWNRVKAIIGVILLFFVVFPLQAGMHLLFRLLYCSGLLLLSLNVGVVLGDSLDDVFAFLHLLGVSAHRSEQERLFSALSTLTRV